MYNKCISFQLLSVCFSLCLLISITNLFVYRQIDQKPLPREGKKPLHLCIITPNVSVGHYHLLQLPIQSLQL